MLFQSLREQEVPDGYIYLLDLLYARQQGILGDTHVFNITRGVRQGDVLSPTLFNAALEQALRKWKQSLTTHGLALVPDDQAERITNIRYADDILLIGKSLEEVVEMLELLAVVLQEYGLELNVGKTMIFTNDEPPDTTTLAEVGESFVAILRRQGVHKYLGRAFSGDLRNRGQCALDHRLACGWGKFKALQGTLTDKNVSVKLRLKLFDAVVTPTVLYALQTAPLAGAQLRKLDVSQRCMLRRMVGWVCDDNDSWQERGSRMKQRLERALALHPVANWSERVTNAKAKLVAEIESAPLWTKRAHEWHPVSCAMLNGMTARRHRGRPRTRCI